MAKTSKAMAATKALMGALLRQPPKQHDEMKVGKPKKVSKRKSKKPGKLE